MSVALASSLHLPLAGMVRAWLSGFGATSDMPASAPREDERVFLWDGTDELAAAPLGARNVVAHVRAPSEFSLPEMTPSGAATATDNPDVAMAALAVAAEQQDEQAFLRAAGLMDWSQRSAALFLQAIQWALAAGAHRAAGELAARGAAQHPGSIALENAARLLAPPTVRAQRLAADPSVAANRAWLAAHRNQYRGLWVALRQGEVLASAATLDALTARIMVNPEILFTRVD